MCVCVCLCLSVCDTECMFNYVCMCLIVSVCVSPSECVYTCVCMFSTCQADGQRETNHRHGRPSCSPNLVRGGERGGKKKKSCRLSFKRLMLPRNGNEWEDKWSWARAHTHIYTHHIHTHKHKLNQNSNAGTGIRPTPEGSNRQPEWFSRKQTCAHTRINTHASNIHTCKHMNTNFGQGICTLTKI